MTKWISISLLIVVALVMDVSNAKAQVAHNADPCVGKLGFQPILRQDFTDIPIIGCGSVPDAAGTTALKTAVGARASYTYDAIHGASGGSLDGLAALNFQYSIPQAAPFLSRISFGPYAQGSGSHTFETGSTPANTSGMVTTGGFFQVFVERPLPVDRSIPVIVRLRGGALDDNTGVRDGAAVGELIPTFELGDLIPALPEPLGGFQFGSEQVFHGLKYIISPEVEAQYDSYQAGPLTYALFAAHHEAMRVGPLVVLKFYGFEDFVDSASPLFCYSKRLTVSVTYHADWDVLSDRRYYSFQPAVIYNFDDTGKFALTTSYGIGDSEFSGNQTRLVKIAFAAKF